MTDTPEIVERIADWLDAFKADPFSTGKDKAERLLEVVGFARLTAERDALFDAAKDAGREAYVQGYRDGFVDHHVRETGEWPDDDGASLLRGMDTSSLSDGWSNYEDTFRAQLKGNSND